MTKDRNKTMKTFLLIIFAIYYAVSPIAADNPVIVAGIKNHAGVPVIDSLSITQGCRSSRCRDIGVLPVPGENRRPLLVVYDSVGTMLYHTAFAFPSMRTVPPLQPETPGSGEPDVIVLEEPEVFLVVPMMEGASLIAVYNPLQREPTSIATLDEQQTLSSKHSLQEADAPDRLKILIIASGFDATGMNEFRLKSRELKDYILAREPFKSYKDTIEVNFYENLLDMDCTVGCGGIARLMCCHSGKVINVAASSGYLFDEIIVLHNTDTYSGGGFRESSDGYKLISYNSYAMSFTGKQYKEVALHEFGHSFGNLCDEYTYSNEGYLYSPCVNCRENCGDWKSISEMCQTSCDTRNDYFRPENSIMLSLGYTDFNDVSIYSKYLPDGLERRIQFFSGINTLLYISIDLERLWEKAWILKKEYGKITISFQNPTDYGIAKFILHRKIKGETFSRLAELSANDFSNEQQVYLDKFLESGQSYIYKIEAEDKAGIVIGESDEMGI